MQVVHVNLYLHMIIQPTSTYNYYVSSFKLSTSSTNVHLVVHVNIYTIH
jgi:hypothetical protein